MADAHSSGPPLSLSGDGSPEAAALVAASERQRAGAAAWLEEVFPGFGAEARVRHVGLDTPTVLPVAATAPAAWAGDGVLDAIDRVFAAGDLGHDRGMVVDPDHQRGVPVSPHLRTPRFGPSTPTNLDPYTGVDLLRRSHTLVLNDAQHALGGHVAKVCEQLAVAFRSHVQVNVYASFGDARGFGAHWDDHDVVIVPVAGRKYWEVRAPGELGPIAGFTPRQASGDPVWSGVLAPGRALAIPRGWPHEVHGIDGEPSVHLTFSNRRALGTDLFANIHPDAVAIEGWRFGEADLEHALGHWRGDLAAFPRNGPLAVLAAQADGYANQECHLALLGGAVFAPHACKPETLVLRGGARTIEVHRRLVPGLVHALDNRWWSVTSLAAAGIAPTDAAALIDTLGSAGLVHLRAAT